MDGDPGDQRRASLRASDADRERFVETLRRHHADGRLTADELAERTERGYAARTFGDLDALATDLPPLRPQDPPPGQDGRTGGGLVRGLRMLGPDVRPGQFVIEANVLDRLPLTASGKIAHRELREPVADQIVR